MFSYLDLRPLLDVPVLDEGVRAAGVEHPTQRVGGDGDHGGDVVTKSLKMSSKARNSLS